MSKNPSFASRWNVDEIDRQYALWLKSPSHVSTEWQYFFEGFHLASDSSIVPKDEANVESSVSPNEDAGESMPDFMERYTRLEILVTLRALLIRFEIMLKKIPAYLSKDLASSPTILMKFILLGIIWVEFVCP